MNNNECQKLIKSILGKNISNIDVSCDNLYFSISQNLVLRCMSILNSNAETLFSSLIDCFAVDYTQQRDEFSIYYQLHSYKIDKSIFIVTNVKKNVQMQSATVLFENANWYEREIFDMFGIVFNDHPDMRRILSRDEIRGFPMLKFI